MYVCVCVCVCVKKQKTESLFFLSSKIKQVCIFLCSYSFFFQ